MGRREWDKTIRATNVERRRKRCKALPLYGALQSEFQDTTSSEDEDEIQRKDEGGGTRSSGPNKKQKHTTPRDQFTFIPENTDESDVSGCGEANMVSEPTSTGTSGLLKKIAWQDSEPIRYGTRVRLNKLDLEMIHEKQLDPKTMRWCMDHMARELNFDEDNAVVIVTIDLVHNFRNRGWEAVRKMVPQFSRLGRYYGVLLMHMYMCW
eukprot:g37702.t1